MQYHYFEVGNVGPMVRCHPSTPPPDARAALIAHLAGLALAPAVILGFAVLMVLSPHWLTG
ncbi:hypothetical protein [Paraburkholderia sp. RL17-337-BIB-A]|uniref:hypothetical protein n=1 Tax=Paraburkholderia sp. RL17-337-BIB-A TaxID=3031636 RepID=UPI0038BE1B50